jgi:hypothetical protein
MVIFIKIIVLISIQKSIPLNMLWAPEYLSDFLPRKPPNKDRLVQAYWIIKTPGGKKLKAFH